MLDIGLGEFIVIAGIAVLVISPKQLPIIAKTLAVTFARVQGFITSIKQEIHQQSDALGLAELKRDMRNTQILAQEELDRMLHPSDPTQTGAQVPPSDDPASNNEPKPHRTPSDEPN